MGCCQVLLLACCWLRAPNQASKYAPPPFCSSDHVQYCIRNSINIEFTDPQIACCLKPTEFHQLPALPPPHSFEKHLLNIIDHHSKSRSRQARDLSLPVLSSAWTVMPDACRIASKKFRSVHSLHLIGFPDDRNCVSSFANLCTARYTVAGI